MVRNDLQIMHVSQILSEPKQQNYIHKVMTSVVFESKITKVKVTSSYESSKWSLDDISDTCSMI